MQKRTILKSTAIALPIILLATLGASVTYAAQATNTTEASSVVSGGSGGQYGMRHGRGMEMNNANHTALEAAITANDFAKFQTLSASSPFRTITTQVQFDQLVKAHTLMKSGDTAGAKAIFDTLGLKSPGVGHQGMGRGGFGNQAAHTAVENNDFTAWKTAMSAYSNQTALTQDLFNKMVQVETLQKEIHTALGD
jgi:hypothetical protein